MRKKSTNKPIPKMEWFCIMTIQDDKLFYDKMILATNWEAAESLCDENEFVHGKYVSTINWHQPLPPGGGGFDS